MKIIALCAHCSGEDGSQNNCEKCEDFKKGKYGTSTQQSTMLSIRSTSKLTIDTREPAKYTKDNPGIAEFSI